MPTRRQQPLPRLDITLDDVPSTDSRRTLRLNLSFAPAELAMLERAARERGEQPSVLGRTIILTVLRNSAKGALAAKPHIKQYRK